MGKVFCSDCEYCKAVNRENSSAKCQHPKNIVDENWHSVAAKDTCAFINKNNDCTWFEDRRVGDLPSHGSDVYDL
jgi:hypothetical protein